MLLLIITLLPCAAATHRAVAVIADPDVIQKMRLSFTAAIAAMDFGFRGSGHDVLKGFLYNEERFVPPAGFPTLQIVSKDERTIPCKSFPLVNPVKEVSARLHRPPYFFE